MAYMTVFVISFIDQKKLVCVVNVEINLCSILFCRLF